MSLLTTTESMPSELDLDLDQELAKLYESEKLDCSCCEDTQPCEGEENRNTQIRIPSIKVTQATPPGKQKRKRLMVEREEEESYYNVPSRFHEIIWIEEAERPSCWIRGFLDDEHRFEGKYHYQEVLPLELWSYIFKIRAALQARAALAPAVFVLRQFRKTVESSWAVGSLAYARVAEDVAKNPKFFFGPYLSHGREPQALWDIPVDAEGKYIVELHVPDHPFYPKESEDCFYDTSMPCNGSPSNPNLECSICDQMMQWCIALSYGELLMWERPLWVMKKLGVNGTWPGWEDSPSYLRTLAIMENKTEAFCDEWMEGHELDERRPDLAQPQFIPKDILPSKWQPIIALSVILDIIMQAPLDGKHGSFSSSHVAWESTPWATVGWDTTFYATPDCAWSNPLGVRTLGFGCGASLHTTPFVNQYLSTGGTHCPASVRNHRVINQFGEGRNHFVSTAPPSEAVLTTVTSHTWYFAEDGYEQLPECAYSMSVPILNEVNNPLYSATALAAGELSGSKLFDKLAARASGRREVSIVSCPGNCRIEDVEKKTISWKVRMDSVDGPWQAFVPTGRLTMTKPTTLKDGDYRTHGMFKSLHLIGGNNHSWSLFSDKPPHHCYGTPLYEKRIGALLQEDTEKIRNQVPAHWCLAWRASNRMKQILPVVNNPRIRYIEGQLPLAMALFSAMAWEATSFYDHIQNQDKDLFTAFSKHAVIFAGSSETSSGPQKLVHEMSLSANRLTVLWDKMRALSVPRLDVVEHVLVSKGYGDLVWSKKESMPFVLKSKRAVWEFQRKDSLPSPLKKPCGIETYW